MAFAVKNDSVKKNGDSNTTGHPQVASNRPFCTKCKFMVTLSKLVTRFMVILRDNRHRQNSNSSDCLNIPVNQGLNPVQCQQLIAMLATNLSSADNSIGKVADSSNVYNTGHEHHEDDWQG